MLLDPHLSFLSYLVGLRMNLAKDFFKKKLLYQLILWQLLEKISFYQRQAVRSSRASEKEFNLSRDGH